MATLRIGIIGLGSIACKAWLPVLSVAREWTVIGAFSPNASKALPICEMYRIPYFSSLESLAQQSDAVFVHTSTASHYTVVQRLLELGVNVLVDKPLAETLGQAEALVSLAAKKKRTLMVGFNRRFSPFYRALKQHMPQASSLLVDKHRIDSVGPQDAGFTLLDDYLHVVDTALWLGASPAKLLSGVVHTTSCGALWYAEHHFQVNDLMLTTRMHRRAGSQREVVQAITQGGIYEVSDMRQWREERGDGLTERTAPSWQSTLEMRGFQDCALHFIRCVANQTEPETAGEQALLAQRIIAALSINDVTQ